MLLLRSKVSKAGNLQLPRSCIFSIRLLLMSIFFKFFNSIMGKLIAISLELRFRVYRDENLEFLNSPSGTADIWLLERSSFSSAGIIKLGRVPAMELWCKLSTFRFENYEI